MKMLNQINKIQPNSQISEFLLKINPNEKNRRPSIDCEEIINAIPLPQGDMYDPIPMKMEEILKNNS